jgi:prevent-host-death family protein
MKTTTITKAKNQLSAVLRDVRRGETVVIMHRGKPVARISPVTAEEQGRDRDRLARLVAAGLLRPATTSRHARLLDSPPRRVAPGSGLLDALLEERLEGR